MSTKSSADIELDSVGDEVLAELIRRVQEIDTAYRAVAQKMGLLYMYADRHALPSLTRSLDKPMRHAADIERTAAAILDTLRMNSKRRTQRKK